MHVRQNLILPLVHTVHTHFTVSVSKTSDTYQTTNRRSVMTFEKAVKQLSETRTLSTELLKPLNISMEAFLRLGQMSKERSDLAVERLIKKLNSCK